MSVYTFVYKVANACAQVAVYVFVSVHYLQSQLKLVLTGWHIADRSNLSGNWKCNCSKEIRDFRNLVEKLIQRTLVMAATGDRLWEFLEHRIRDFTSKYCQKLVQEKARIAKSMEERLIWAVDERVP